MVEHLILYFIEDLQINRAEVEIEILLFFMNLKYYADRKWPRALAYAQLI